MLKTPLFVLLGFVFSLLLPFAQQQASAAIAAKVIISEIKLGGGDEITFPDETKARDFVTLYNQSSEPIALDGWTLQYAKATSATTDCTAQFAAGSSSDLSGTLLPGAASSPIKRQMNDATDGALRLIDPTGIINDLVGWGLLNKCYDKSPAPTPANGKSLQRYIDCETSVPIDTDDNAADFAIVDTPSPGLLSGPITTDCSETPPADDGNDTDNDDTDTPGDTGETPDIGGQGAGHASTCDGLIINELLVNPAGSDTGHEFIEIYNPTDDDISLNGCKLQTSANTKLYTFEDLSLSPGQYKAFYNDLTGLTLANSAGGSAYLIDTDNTEISQVEYQADLDDDVSWSFFDDAWQPTYLITADRANELLESKPCPSGQIRNAETNRCINVVEEAAGLAPCPAGKKRNPATNRCRNIATLASVLKACAADQVRNPLTNRCKKITTSSLTPCRPGQTRNPDTHRCRKTVGDSDASGIKDVKDVLSTTSAVEKSSWLVAALSMSGALVYAVWEWRNEIFEQLGILRGKFSL